jgi:phosphoribosylamine--glycine ligase
VIDALRREGVVYRGVLYVGLMMTEEGPRVLEYNVRFGDPEAQAVLPRLKTDLLTVLHQIASGKLETSALEWDARPALCVVMASRGYPGSYQTGFPVSGVAAAEALSDVNVFHAGTALDDQGRLVTSGGRVLAVTARGVTLKDSQERAYEAVRLISFDGALYRTDIGKRALSRNLVSR